jgi:hypothetical protein
MDDLRFVEDDSHVEVAFELRLEHFFCTSPYRLTEISRSDEDGRLHWKTRALVAWADGRSFVWVDDEIGDADRAWVSAHHRGLTLLHRVDPRYGPTDADFAVLGEWLRSA